MPVPEAPMDKNYRPVGGERDIGNTGQISPVEAVAEPGTVERLPDLNFMPGILRPDIGHHPAANRRVHNIGHHAPPG